MTPKKPTNADLFKELREIKTMQASQDGRISTLEQWKVAEDAYRAALARVKDDEEKENYRGLRDKELKRRTEILKQVGIVLGLLAAILYAYAATHGIHT